MNQDPTETLHEIDHPSGVIFDTDSRLDQGDIL